MIYFSCSHENLLLTRHYQDGELGMPMMSWDKSENSHPIKNTTLCSICRICAKIKGSNQFNSVRESIHGLSRNSWGTRTSRKMPNTCSPTQVALGPTGDHHSKVIIMSIDSSLHIIRNIFNKIKHKKTECS